ncbi:MAG TPA: glycosyltransferase family 39 protein [Chloroflexota bacterium]|nr:glycosyltransferase family 39 protein [Chloroflexota bacterium]
METKGIRIMTLDPTLGNTADRVGSPNNRRFFEVALLATALVLIAAMAAYNLADYPTTWFDEGINLLAARELATTGHYGLTYSGAFHPFDESLSTGPTVIVPIALTFKIFGAGLIQGRIVMVAYLLLAAAGLAVVAWQLYDLTVATVSLFVAAALTQAGFFANGRDALGEIPAVAFLLWGTAAFIEARRTKLLLLDVVAGILLGLAILTKNQFILVAPVILYSWFVAHPEKGSFPFPRFLIVGILVAAPTGLWFAYQLSVMGPSGFIDHLRGMSQTASASAYGPPFAKAASAVNFLISSGFVGTGVAGLLYVWLAMLKNGQGRKPAQIFLPAFVTLCLLWYVGFSMGYPRYVVPATLVGSLFAGKLIVDLGRSFTPLGRLNGRLSLQMFLEDALGTGLAVILTMVIFAGILQNGLTIARTKDSSPQVFATVVMQRVPAGAEIESSQWEIDFLTSRLYHHPPPRLVDEVVGVLFLGESPRVLQDEYRVPEGATYLIDGPFSKAVGLYRSEIDRGEFTKVTSVGQYDLYRRVNSAGTR